MKYAIIGYGNLGKSIERLCGEQLAAVYSRRKLTHPLYRPMREVGKVRNFDVALCAMGSYADIGEYADRLASLDTVDSYDVHGGMAEYKARLNALKRDSLAIIGAGWDPGVLSIQRGLLGIGAEVTATLWGEGVSQGHSNALRAIPGVIDAVQFTLPKPEAAALIAEGVTDGRQLHERVCYVAAVEADKEQIRERIVDMPDYFRGYTTHVHFVTPREVRALRLRTSHRGQVLSIGKGFRAQCTLTLECNTDYTARIMLAYARALPQLKKDGYTGALDVLDIPLRYLCPSNVL